MYGRVGIGGNGGGNGRWNAMVVGGWTSDYEQTEAEWDQIGSGSSKTGSRTSPSML